MSALEVAARVLHDEAEAILKLIDRLDTSFEDAVNLISHSSGRVILTGMGKSGHIAKKYLPRWQVQAHHLSFYTLQKESMEIWGWALRKMS